MRYNLRHSIHLSILVSAIILFSYGKGYSQITLSSPDYLDHPSTIIAETVKQENITSYYQINGLSSVNRNTTYKYLDGFCRPLQDVISASTPAGYDFIHLYTYDDFGRQTKSYLPYQAATSDGSYYDRSTAISDQATFYTTNNTSNKITYEDKPYMQSEMEESPMQRLIKQGNVGDGFQTNQNYKTMDYRANTSGDAVKKWSNSGTTSSSYSAGELNVTISADENGYELRTFRDKLGRMVLKRQQADETIGGNFYAWFDTYFVYDNSGNVIYVVPPKAVYRLGVIGGTWNVTSVPDLTYSYIYDYKNRIIQKKIPNAAVIYMVYDPLDRIVLMQDGNLRANDNWYFSKYDSRGRTAYEGIYTNTSITTLSGMQSLVDGQSCYTSGAHYEGRTTSSSFQYYTNTCFPTFNASPTVYYYYDDYDFDNAGGADASYQSQSLTGEIGGTDKTSGLLTGINKVVIGTSTYLLQAIIYDKWYNVVQIWDHTLLTASVQLKTAVYDFGGRLNYSKENSSAGTKLSGVTHSKLNSYTYDKMNRLLEVTQSNDGGTAVLVGHYEYNPVGQLVDKKLHSTNSGSTYLQSVDYRYNSRGQVTTINNSTLNNDSGVTNDESNDIFGMTLLYDQTDGSLSNTGTYTGMLSAVKWKTVSPAVTNQRAYLFSYDKLSRLNLADYREHNGSNWTTLNYQGYNETINYDWNGNIKRMQRSSVISSTVTAIDDLAYNYGTNDDNNQLANITESSSNSYGYRNLTSSGSAYSYDANGNLTTDPKKGVTITYNELNKVAKIREIASPNKYVEYRYDGLGNVISRAVFTGSLSITTTTYSGSFTYEGATLLKEVTMPEGKVRYASSVFTFEYFITDQQGNVRVSFEDGGGGTAALRQENSYYPFGMSMNSNYLPGSSDNKYLYNAGSQLQDEFSGLIDYYNTFYRQYDPILGRFNGVDPRAEVTMELSVYHYSGNNPVNFNDPMGDLRQEVDPSGFLVAAGSTNQVFSNNVIEFDLYELIKYLNQGGGGFGGTWSAESGEVTFFQSPEEAMMTVAIQQNLGVDFFFDNNGVFLRAIRNPGRTNVVVSIVLPGRQLEFQEQVEAFDWIYASNSEDIKAVAMAGILPFLQMMSTNYDLDEYFDWASTRNKDPYTGSDFTDGDGKGQLYIEHLTHLELGSDNFMHIMKGIDEKGDIGKVDPVNSNPTLHNHVNEGRRFYDVKYGGYATFQTPEAGGMRTDMRVSHWSGRNYFDVVVVGNRIYLYNNSGLFFQGIR